MLVRLRVRAAAWCAILPAALASAGVASEVALTDRCTVRFAAPDEGREALARRDDYIRQLSPFDRQVRLKTDQPVSEQQFVDFVASHVRPWTNEEIARMTSLLVAVGEKLRDWKLPLPPVILLVKTSGQEEGRAAYCRGNAIVLPQNMVDNPANLPNVLPHEVFHVLSSHNPSLRERLYATIGFHPTNEVSLPEPLAHRKITNPDAPLNNYYLTAASPEGAADWLPVLVSKHERYDPRRGGSLFDYLDFKLLKLQRDDAGHRPALANGQPVLVEPAQVPGFAEQIGANTRYIIHPEEILADNFVLLIGGRVDVPTPRILEAMGTVLQTAAAP